MFRLYEYNFSSTIELVTAFCWSAPSWQSASAADYRRSTDYQKTSRLESVDRESVAGLVGRREIAPARPHRHSRLRHLHFELVHLAVERGGSKPDQVLAA